MDAPPSPVEPSAEPNPPAQHPPDLIAIIDDYDSLLATIRARIRLLNTTHSAIEEMSGLPNRYLGKV
ncbi:MAG: hypothetical protein WAV38_14585 [Xanthobacteraceae bacterium]